MVDYIAEKGLVSRGCLLVRCDESYTMSNDTHITDVGWAVHEGPDLVCMIATVSTT